LASVNGFGGETWLFIFHGELSAVSLSAISFQLFVFQLQFPVFSSRFSVCLNWLRADG
jgi:hypothetical protein